MQPNEGCDRKGSHTLPIGSKENATVMLRARKAVRGRSARNAKSKAKRSPGRGSRTNVQTTIELEVDLSTRSTSVSVTKLLSTIVDGSGASAPMTKIVESLLLPFLARRKGVRFSDKEYGRMVSSWKMTLSNLQEMEDDENREMDFLKYHLGCLMCKVARSEILPDKPAFVTKPLFTGWLKRCVKLAVVNHDYAFCYSLLMSKLAWPELTKKREAMALSDHKVLICGPARGKPRRDLYEMIQQTSLEIFGGQVNKTGSFTEKAPIPTKFMPTGSACMQASRKEHGTASLFHSMETDIEETPLGPLRDLNNATDSWRQASYEHARSNVESRIYERDSGILDVEVQIIPKPAGFRTLTKGDGYLYTALQPVQGQMLSAWKQHPTSTMIVDLDDSVQKLYDVTKKHKDWEFSSVDYKSATDLLNKWSTNAAFEPLTFLFDSKLAWQSLQNAVVHYPDGDVLDQVEGQLMGHPLSFPLLCTINLACYRCALMRWLADDESRLEDVKILWSNVLVNGDDMLFRAPPSFFPVFLQVTKEAGLVVSLGKNYNSKHIALINSQMYRLDGHNRMIRCGYLNQRLLSAGSKESPSLATPDQIGKDVGEMVRHCPWAKGCIPMAFERWKPRWTGWFKPNWFLPVHLGGYGVPLQQASEDWKVTRGQRKMASKFISNSRLQLYRREGFSIETAKFASSLANFEVVPRFPAEEEKEERDAVGVSENITDDWLIRAAYISRAMQLKQEKVSDKVMLLRSGRVQQKLKPMSDRGMAKWWHVATIAHGLPACPPLQGIKGDRPDRDVRRDFQLKIPRSHPFGRRRGTRRAPS